MKLTGMTILMSILFFQGILMGSGHGPVFGLATPTLPRSGWSLDTGFMDRVAGNRHSLMFRVMAGYGITEDVQISLSLPVPLSVKKDFPATRGTAMMPMRADGEILLAWRFHRKGVNVGTRFESTAYAGFALPAQERQRGIRANPALSIAAVTGYASRSLYFWLGGWYQHHIEWGRNLEEQQGNILIYSLVAGYRPGIFRQDYPSPDWRVFLEATGEIIGRDGIRGVIVPDSDGHILWIGPSLLGLYGPWGISLGIQFPFFRIINNASKKESGRWMFNFTYWW